VSVETHVRSAIQGFAMAIRRHNFPATPISSRTVSHCNAAAKSALQAELGLNQDPAKAQNHLWGPASQVRTTFGEKLPRLRIESVADPRCPGQLALCIHDFKSTQIRPFFQYHGVTYVPGWIAPGLAQLVRFPSARQSPGSTENLVSDLQKFLMKYLDQDLRTIHLLIAFVFASWFVDFFQVAPVLCLYGPKKEVSLVLRLLHIMCFHPVLVGDLDISALKTLPSGFGVTLLVNQVDLAPRVERALFSSTRRHFHFATGKHPIDIFGARALHRESSSGEVGLDLFIRPARSCFTSLTENDEHAAAVEFQSKLLAHRMSHRNPGHQFELEARTTYLGLEDQLETWVAALPPDADLRKSVLSAFDEYQDRLSAMRYEDPKCLVAEAALLFCHRKETKHFYVRELTEKVNDLLLGRHADLKLENRKIGSVLKTLGIPTQRVTRGYRVKLDEQIRKRIHCIAGSYRVLSVNPDAAHCTHCGQGISLQS
jgi:hypothetical protein